MRNLKPYFSAANIKMKQQPENFGLPSNKQIQQSVYLKKTSTKK
jgi:hypothetical protein